MAVFAPAIACFPAASLLGLSGFLEPLSPSREELGEFVMQRPERIFCDLLRLFDIGIERFQQSLQLRLGRRPVNSIQHHSYRDLFTRLRALDRLFRRLAL